jgi:hypothetical protein
MKLLDFTDKIVSYQTFVDDISARVVELLKSDRDDPEYVSQRMAYRLFGRRNVERWRKQNRVEPRKRPGKLEYPMAELRLLQRTSQDYFE